jgi:signal transduction histidine kinase
LRAAHELINPLTLILGYADLIQNRPGLDSETREDLQKIKDAARRAIRIVDNLLEFGKAKRQEKRLTDINKALRRTLELVDYQLKADNIRVITELDEEIPWTVADGYQLQQAFFNIINNAHYAMKGAHGRGTLIVRSKLLEGEGLDSAFIRIEFIDDGPGIPQEIMPKLFEPFFTTKQEGLGLGLSVCREIVEHHGGRIWAEDAPMGGAKFVIEIPLRELEWP